MVVLVILLVLVPVSVPAVLVTKVIMVRLATLVLRVHLVILATPVVVMVWTVLMHQWVILLLRQCTWVIMVGLLTLIRHIAARNWL